MRTFVRLLPRLLVLGVVAAALLVLAERARSAHADALPPITSPELTEPALPPVTTPSLPAPPPSPVPPPITAPALPPITTPSLSARPIPSIAAPAPAAPSLGGTELPTPAVPAPPGVPDVDPERLSSVVGPLPTAPTVPAVPKVPEVTPPQPGLPELPSLPAVPDAPAPLDRVLALGATPASDAPGPVNAPDRAPPAPLAEPAPSRLLPREPGGTLVSVDIGLTPARGPPANVPGSPHPCPGGGSPHPTRTDQAAFLAPATDDASRRGGLPADARVYASTLLRDPLLRPD